MAGLPYFSESTYYVNTITHNEFTIAGTAAGAVANGSPLSDVRIQYNTAPNITGAKIVSAGSWTNPPVRGLKPFTTYYYRVGLKNVAYGWGPMGAWKIAMTMPDPEAPIYNTWVKVGGVWKVAGVYVKVNGVWEYADSHVKVNGVWEQ